MPMNPKDLLLAKLSEMEVPLKSRDALAIESVAEETELTRNIADRDLEAAKFNRCSVNVKEILEAISRVDAGEYGVCVDCEEPIAARRLAALPWAKRCIGCQERMEHRLLPGAILRDDDQPLAA